MSLLLIVLSMLLAAALFRRIRTNARTAILRWAREYGYRVEATDLVSAFGNEPHEAGRAADLVFRVVLSSPSEGRRTAHALLWGLLPGPATVVVRWDGPSRRDSGQSSSSASISPPRDSRFSPNVARNPATS